MIFDDPNVIIQFLGYLTGAYGIGFALGYSFYSVKRLIEFF